PRQSEGARHGTGAPPMMARTILVVDDDAPILEVLEMRLAAMGFAVTSTDTPAEALRILGERAFDVALFDLRMDDMDGIALTHAAHEKQSRLPVLIMTAHGTIDNAVDAIKEGAFDFITKPFVPEELTRKLERALLERRWARDRDLLRTVGEMLASSGVVEHVLEVIAERTLEATETTRAVVFLREEGRVAARAVAGAAPSPIADLATAAAVLVDGAAEGALVAESPSYVVPTEDDLLLLAIFAAQAAVALKNAREQSRLRGGALAALGRVATQVAHELNNPLGGLKLYAQLLEDRLAKAGDPQGVDMAQKVGRAVTHLGDLVADITAYGRPPELRREPTAVNALVDECLALAQDRIAEKHIVVVRELDDALGELTLDPRELKKALLNFVLNGLEAMEDGGTLTVRTGPTDDRGVAIAIEDTGRGMAIARSVVDRHDGRLAIDTAPGNGTRIRLTIPPDARESR